MLNWLDNNIGGDIDNSKQYVFTIHWFYKEHFEMNKWLITDKMYY